MSKMDKSPSTHCQEVDDGSWDLDENNQEALLESLENLSSNSWDSSSEKDGKLALDDDLDDCEGQNRETEVEVFRKEDSEEEEDGEVVEEVSPSNSWRSSNSHSKKIIKAKEKFGIGSGSDSLEEIDISLPDRSGNKTGEVQEFCKVETRSQEECLVVEDLEEPESEGDDTSIWKIPLSDRSDSSEDSVFQLLQNLRQFSRKKSKSHPNLAKLPNRTKKKSRSFERLTVTDGLSLKDALMQFEGSRIESVKEKSKKMEDPLAEILDLGDRSHFQEIECRTLRTIITNVKKEALDVSEGDDPAEEAQSCCDPSPVRSQPGTSNKTDEVVSMPDVSGKSDNSDFRKTTSYTTSPNYIGGKPTSLAKDQATESWILLDEMGQSQPVTMMEVNLLLNGRSADAVLQENKEHFIPRSTVVRNANSDVRVNQWNPLVEESLQHFLNEEDVGGEESASKSIGLERKFGNMLLFIQSGVNLTSSVRFIPVDTEMIHMWRQSKENVSSISSEDDARAVISDHITEETSEFENQETSDEFRFGENDPQKLEQVVRKRRNRYIKSDDTEHRMIENRRIIESLNDDVKQLRMRLETERSRSSSLEQEVYRLRGQLDKLKSGQSSSESQKTKSETGDECKKLLEGSYVPEITSSSLLSFDGCKYDSDLKSKKDAKPGRLPENVPDNGLTGQRQFKDALDKSMCDIQEILSRNPKNPKDEPSRAASGKFLQLMEESRIPSSVSVNTFTIAESNSLMLSETTGSSIDSWLKLKAPDSGHQKITQIINELEKENEQLVMENLNLKKKLNEISIELEEYIVNNIVSTPAEEGKQTESLRNQVCNLKLELENLKSLAKNKEQSYRLKDAIVREELAEKSVSLEEWRTSILSIFREIDDSREKLGDIGITIVPISFSDVTKLPSNDIIPHLRSVVMQLTSRIADCQSENSILKKSLKESFMRTGKNVINPDRAYEVNFVQDIPGMLLGNFQKDNEDYHKLISDNASLNEELRNLRKENDLLLEYQIELNEKIKNLTIALREEKSKVDGLEKACRLSELERSEISQVMMSYQKEKSILESELDLERKKFSEVRTELEKRKIESKDWEERLEELRERCRNLEEASQLKDEMIRNLKSSFKELEAREVKHNGQIQYLSDELKKAERQKSDLEEELTSYRLTTEDSKRGMSEYINHLETMVGNAEDNITEMKDKYNETFRTLTNLKKTHEELELQNSTNTKMLKKTKEEVENYKEMIRDLEESNRKNEEGKRKALCDLNTIVKSEKEKTETLEKMLHERKMLDDEMSALKLKAETQAKTRDRLLKEQKDFINEIAILKKENDRLGQKYRYVKSECNERTRMLKMLDGKLNENFFEYNKRIACLERNVSEIIEKAAAYKDTVMEKRSEVDTLVRELQGQLQAVYTEKKGLENEASNFYTNMRHLQKEINEKEKRVKKLNFLMDDVQNSRTTTEVGSETGAKNEEEENRMKRFELEAQEKIRTLESSKDEERMKYEAIIADLKTQINRYQIRLDVMLKNITAYGKTIQEPISDKRETDDQRIAGLEARLRELTEDLDRKRKRIFELTEVIENNESEMKRKGSECDLMKEKILQLKEEIKSMRSQFSKLQEFLATVSRNVETYQKERDEMSEKLAKSLKLIVEERASKQSSETIFAEKEKFFKEQLEQLKGRLTEKKKDYESLLKLMDEKKDQVTRLQEDVRKWKSEVAILKAEVNAMKEHQGGNEEDGLENGRKSSSAELKEIRAYNLELRKKEGNLQARIVHLEDDLRGARLLIKELEGDLRTEKTSKKLLKEMITSAKDEIDRSRMSGQISNSVAEKIERHFNLSEAQSRELFSGYRTTGDDLKTSIFLLQ